MGYYIYILYSSTSNIYYVGHSENPQRRLMEHNNPQRKKFTSKHLPWQMKTYFEIASDRGTAMKAERIIKRKKTRKYIESLFNDVGEQQKLA
ncbi:MAG: GIY-YIG nuclease family protein [Bacteroidia bacterium]|nr:GIY-YIG nuclease family protein [Bacteroidia bacterium]